MNKRQWLAATLLVALMGGCATAPTPKTLADTAAANAQLSTFNKLVDDAGLRDSLATAGPLTVFAPTDDAFKAVPAKTMESLANDKARLAALLNYHIAQGKLDSAGVKNGPLKTLQGSNVALSKSGTFVTVEDAVVTTPDVQATNGVLHIVDRVLVPPAK